MTDCERVLAALRQGPRTASELYALHCIVHSRVADLRKRGHVITCIRVPGEGAKAYVYTLELDAGLGATETHDPCAAADGVDSDSVAPNPAQMVLV